MNEKLIPLAKGAIKHVPFIKWFLDNRTGGTIESRYCYSVWMRHLKHLDLANDKLPHVIAELGPGDSLGIGFAALLSGCKKLYAFDVVRYWDVERNLMIFDELVNLFKNRNKIPDQKEYPLVQPQLDNYNFPDDLLSDDWLNINLSEQRILSIRKEISDIDNPKNKFITVHIPWNTDDTLESNSVDFIYSQAVLQHIEELESAYKSMKKWLKPDGMMAHTIDFKSMGTTNSWNGHWSYSDFEWKIVKGGKTFLINRHPYSYHLLLHQQNGFKILKPNLVESENKLPKHKLAKRFKDLTAEDLTTSGAYILSQNS